MNQRHAIAIGQEVRFVLHVSLIISMAAKLRILQQKIFGTNSLLSMSYMAIRLEVSRHKYSGVITKDSSAM